MAVKATTIPPVTSGPSKTTSTPNPGSGKTGSGGQAGGQGGGGGGPDAGKGPGGGHEGGGGAGGGGGGDGAGDGDMDAGKLDEDPRDDGDDGDGGELIFSEDDLSLGFPDIVFHHDPCFTAGTMITLSDGSLKRIEDMTAGDMVVTQFGSHPVIRLIPTPICDRLLYTLGHDDVFFVTAEHPFMTRDGWKSIDSNAVINPALHADITGSITLGDEVWTEEGWKEVCEIRSVCPESTGTLIYNLEIKSDHSYYANGYLVHNKTVAVDTGESTGTSDEDNDDDDSAQDTPETPPPPIIPDPSISWTRDTDDPSIPGRDTSEGSGPDYNIFTPNASFYSSEPWLKYGLSILQPAIISTTELEPIFQREIGDAEFTGTNITPGHKFLLLQMLSTIYIRASISSIESTFRTDTTLMSGDFGVDSYVFFCWRRLLCNAAAVFEEAMGLLKGQTAVNWSIELVGRLLNFSILYDDRIIKPGLTFKGHTSRPLAGDGQGSSPDTIEFALNGYDYITSRADDGVDYAEIDGRYGNTYDFFINDHQLDSGVEFSSGDGTEVYTHITRDSSSYEELMDEVYSDIFPRTFMNLKKLLGSADLPQTPTASIIQLIQEIRRCYLLGSAALSFSNFTTADAGVISSELSTFGGMNGRYRADWGHSSNPYFVWTDIHNADSSTSMRDASPSIMGQVSSTPDSTAGHGGSNRCALTTALIAISHLDNGTRDALNTGVIGGSGTGDASDIVESYSTWTSWQDFEATLADIGAFGDVSSTTPIKEFVCLSHVLNRDFLISSKTPSGNRTGYTDMDINEDIQRVLTSFFLQVDIVNGRTMLSGRAVDTGWSSIYPTVGRDSALPGAGASTVRRIIDTIIGDNSGDITINTPDRDSISYMFNTHTDSFLQGSGYDRIDWHEATAYETASGYSIDDALEQRILLCESAMLETGTYSGAFIPGLELYIRGLGSALSTANSVESSTWGQPVRDPHSTSEPGPGPLDRLTRHFITLEYKTRLAYQYIAKTLGILSGPAEGSWATHIGSYNAISPTSQADWNAFTSGPLMYEAVLRCVLLILAYGALDNDAAAPVVDSSSSSGVDVDPETLDGDALRDGQLFIVWYPRNLPSLIQIAIMRQIGNTSGTTRARYLAALDNYLVSRGEAQRFIYHSYSAFGVSDSDLDGIDFKYPNSSSLSYYSSYHASSPGASGVSASDITSAPYAHYTYDVDPENMHDTYEAFLGWTSTFGRFYTAATELAEMFLDESGASTTAAIGYQPWFDFTGATYDTVGFDGLSSPSRVLADDAGAVYGHGTGTFFMTGDVPLSEEGLKNPWYGWLGDALLDFSTGIETSTGLDYRFSSPFDVLVHCFDEYVALVNSYMGYSEDSLHRGSTFYGSASTIHGGFNGTGSGGITPYRTQGYHVSSIGEEWRSFYRNIKDRTYRQAMVWMILKAMEPMDINIWTSHSSYGLDLKGRGGAGYEWDGYASTGHSSGFMTSEYPSFGVLCTWQSRSICDLYAGIATSMMTGWGAMAYQHDVGESIGMGVGASAPSQWETFSNVAGMFSHSASYDIARGWAMFQNYRKKLSTTHVHETMGGDSVHDGFLISSHSLNAKNHADKFIGGRNALIREDTILLSAIEVLHDYISTIIGYFTTSVFKIGSSSGEALSDSNSIALYQYMQRMCVGVLPRKDSSSATVIPSPDGGSQPISDYSSISEDASIEAELRTKVNYFLRNISSREALYSSANMYDQMCLSRAFTGTSALLPDPFDHAGQGTEPTQTNHPLLLPAYTQLDQTRYYAMQTMLQGPGFRGLSGTTLSEAGDLDTQRKKIFTIGLPTGFMAEMRRRATTELLMNFDVEAGFEDISATHGPTQAAAAMMDTSLIKITLHKKDLSRPDVIFQPLDFIFDTALFYNTIAKHRASYGEEFTATSYVSGLNNTEVSNLACMLNSTPAGGPFGATVTQKRN